MSNVQKTLTNAFNRRSLCALHIDLLNKYYTEEPESQIYGDVDLAFKTAHLCSQTLARFNIPNFWVAYVKTTETPLTVSEYLRTVEDSENNDVFYTQPALNDIVLPKQKTSLFHPRPHGTGYNPYGYLTKENNKDTFVVTGVYAFGCVLQTIAGLFDQAAETPTGTEEVSVIVIDKSTDHKGLIKNYIEEIKKRYYKNVTRRHRENELMKTNLIHATHDELLATLEAA